MLGDGYVTMDAYSLGCEYCTKCRYDGAIPPDAVLWYQINHSINQPSPAPRHTPSQKILYNHPPTLPIPSPLLLSILLPPMQIVLRRRIKHIKEPLPLIRHLQHTRHIPAPVAIIRRAPHRAQPVLVQHLIPFLAQLVRPQDVVHPVDVQELAHDLRAECVPRPARRQAEFVAFGVGVGPDEVGHGAFVRDFAEAVDDADLVEGVDGGGQAAVDAEDAVVDDDAEGEEVEEVGEVVPYVGVAVFAVAFGVEAVGLRDAAGFVVAADQVHAGWVAKFEEDEEGDGFDGEKAAVDVVAWEQSGISFSAGDFEGCRCLRH